MPLGPLGGFLGPLSRDPLISLILIGVDAVSGQRFYESCFLASAVCTFPIFGVLASFRLLTELFGFWASVDVLWEGI